MYQRLIRQTVPLLAVGALLLQGCGSRYGSDIPPLHPVRGVITLDGEPLANATISIVPDTGPTSGSVTDENGNYELHHRSGKVGAVAGRADVIITTVTMDAEGNMTPEKLPKKYHENTILEMVVKEGEENVHNFDLTSK